VYNSSLFTPALLRSYSFVSFAVHVIRRIFLSRFIRKASRHVYSFFLSVQLSQPYVATFHTSTFISRIFVDIGMPWLFHIFCSDAPIACPLFNLVPNSVVHSSSSIIRDPRYGNVSICSSCLFWTSPVGLESPSMPILEPYCKDDEVMQTSSPRPRSHVGLCSLGPAMT